MKPYEHDGWSNEDQAEFWAFVKRARSRKLDYVRSKAYRLRKAGTDEKVSAAITLANDAVTAYLKNIDDVRDHQKYPASYKSHVLYFCKFLAQTHQQSGDLKEAERWAQTMFEIYADDYSRSSVPAIELYLFADICCDTRNQREAEHAMAMVEAIQDDYRTFADLRHAARNWQRLGHADLSQDRWLQAYSENEDWVAFPSLRDRPVFDVSGAPCSDPEDVAEGIVVNHHGVTDTVFTSDRGALAALDEILGPEGPKSHRADGYQLYYQQETLVPELGAFIGRVCIAQHNASWVKRSPMMHSALRFDGRDLDPFEIAFDRVFFERRLTDWYDATFS